MSYSVSSTTQPILQRTGYATANASGKTIMAGQACCVFGASNVNLANANINGRTAVGLAKNDVPDATGLNVVVDGPFTLPDWTEVVGTPYLSTGADYFLDVVDGMLTTVGSSGATSLYAQKIGKAVNPTTLEIAIQQAILL